MRVVALAIAVSFLSACSTITCNFTGSNNRLTIEQPKTISTTPSLQADGNSIPASVIP